MTTIAATCFGSSLVDRRNERMEMMNERMEMISQYDVCAMSQALPPRIIHLLAIVVGEIYYSSVRNPAGRGSPIQG